MTRLERVVLNTLPVRFITSKSRKVTMPGLQGFSLYDVVLAFIRQVNKVGLSERASSIAFNFIMAIPAATIFLCTLIPYLPITQKANDELLQLAGYFSPDERSYRLIESFLNDFLKTQRTDLLSFSVFLSIYYASNAMTGIMHTFNKSFAKTYRRSFVASRWMAIKLTTLVILLVIISMVLLITQGTLLEWLFRQMNISNPGIKALFDSLRWVIIIALIFFAIAFIYKYAPAVHKRWNLVSAGSIVATCLTILTTFLFSVWVNTFGNYNKVYGSIGTIMIIMLLTYLNSLILLIGFELNVSIYTLKHAGDDNN